MFSIKRVVVCLFAMFVMFLNMPNTCYADTETQKREEIRRQINQLNKLERQESNKLTRNQQKLEKNQRP